MEKEIYCPKCRILIEEFEESTVNICDVEVTTLSCPHCQANLYYESNKIDKIIEDFDASLEEKEDKIESLQYDLDTITYNNSSIPSNDEINGYIDSNIESIR